MNLLTWILSLLIEAVRPLHPVDPVLAPVRSPAPGQPDGDGDRSDRGERGERAEADRDAGPSAFSDPDRSRDEDPERDPALARGGDDGFDDALARDIARDIDWINGGGTGSDRDSDDGGTLAPQGADAGPGETGSAAAALPVRPGTGLSTANPLWRHGDRLIDLLGPRDAPIGWGNWAALILLPIAVVWGLQALLDGLGLVGDLLSLLVGAGIVYFTVPIGRLWRRLDRLSLLAGAGEVRAFRRAVARWNDDDASAASAASAAVEPAPFPGDRALDRAAFVLPLIDAYRDVFAPLFWLVLAGPAGPLAYAMARLAADRRSGVARRALYWVDWVPLRLSSASFAFGGRFDDAMLGLRCALDATRFDRIDVRVDRDATLVQEVIILPTAAGAMDIRLAGPVVEARLAQASADYEEPGTEPCAANFTVLRSLLGRTAMIWGGLWVLLTLVS